MKANVGGPDRAIRIVAAGFYYQSWWGLVGLIPLGTGLFSFCGLYPMLGISTRAKTTSPTAND